MRYILSSVLGQLLLGTLIKNIAPAHWNIESYLAWSNLTVIGLFLMVGLQIQFKKFTRDLLLCGALVVLTTIIPMVCFYYTGTGFGISHISSLTIAVVLVTTGTGVTIQNLSYMKLLHTKVGQFITLVSALDDIPATMCMTYLLFAANTRSSSAAPNNLNPILAIGAVVFLAGCFFISRISHSYKKWLLSAGFLGFAVMSAKFLEAFHISAVMGGLFAGFFLSLVFKNLVDLTEGPIEKILKPFLPFYMISIGMKLNPSILLNAWALSLTVALTIGAVATKWLISYYLLKGRKDLNPSMIAWGMVPRGIPGFAFATSAVAAGLINSELFTILVLIVSFTTWIGLLGLEITGRRLQVPSNFSVPVSPESSSK